MRKMRKEVKGEGQATKEAATVAETAAKVQSAKVAQVEGKEDKDVQTTIEEELSTDDKNIEGSQTLTVPPLVHLKSSSSATSDAFTEVLHTIETSEYIMPPFVGDSKAVCLPMIRDEEDKSRQKIVVVA